MPQSPDVISCEEALSHLEAYLDGDFAGDPGAAVEVHLERCPDCAAEHRLAVTIRSELRSLPQLDAPPAVLAEVYRQTSRKPVPFVGAQAFASPRIRPPATSVRRPAWALLAAAALAAAVLGAPWWLQQPDVTTPGPHVAGSDTDAAATQAVAQATEEARFAIAYLGKVSRRAGLKVHEEVLVEGLVQPPVESLSRVLGPHLGVHLTAAGDNREES